MSRTHEVVLNAATVPTSVVGSLAQLANRSPETQGFGSVMRSLGVSPGLRTRTGLSSSATHIEELPGRIYGVVDAAGTGNLTIIYAGTAGAGQVKVTYSATGIPTLVFGDGANTGYKVEKAEMPAAYAEFFDAIAD